MRLAAESLTARQRDTLLDVFARFADKVSRVDVYGSRARGTHDAGSDVDLLLSGDLSLEDLLAIAVALDESYLSVAADVARYPVGSTSRFAAEVSRDARLLFNGEELQRARAEGRGVSRERHWNTY